MYTSETNEEMSQLKSQLDNVFDRKFIDHSFLLGLNNIIQSRFQTWILTDLNEYYTKVELTDGTQKEVDFDTNGLLEILWNEFHSPIIKFFQFHHATFYDQIIRDFRDSQKDKSYKFKVKPVEMKKINAEYLKINKQIYHFYESLLKYFTTHFKNPLIPSKFLENNQFTVPSSAIGTECPNLQANLLLLIHRCLLRLGDISRHQASIEVSYVAPCISTKNFFKYRALSGGQRSEFVKPYYEKALELYDNCILLLPALHDPFNKKGMVFNVIEDRFEAIYWFLRSSLSRIDNKSLGINNMTSILKKDWFISQLIAMESSRSRETASSTNMTYQEKMNVKLICLIAYQYLRIPFDKTLKKGINYGVIEQRLFEEIKKVVKAKDDVVPTIIWRQTLVLLCFHSMMNEFLKNKDDAKVKFDKFAIRYMENVFVAVMETSGVLNDDYTIKVLRLFFNWLKDHKEILKIFQKSSKTAKIVSDLLNFVISNQEEKRKADLVGSLKSYSRPQRMFYFDEDVSLRDCSVIKFHFRDFKDEHLFKINNNDLFVGDYWSIIKEDSEDYSSDLVDNSLLDYFFNTDIKEYENSLRLQAVIYLGRKVLETTSDYKLDLQTFTFKQNISKIQKSSSKQRNPKETKDRQRKVRGPTSKSLDTIRASNSPKEEKVDVPSSLEDIGIQIRNHRLQLEKQMEVHAPNKEDESSTHGPINNNNINIYTTSQLGQKQNSAIKPIAATLSNRNSIVNPDSTIPSQHTAAAKDINFRQSPYGATNASYFPTMPMLQNNWSSHSHFVPTPFPPYPIQQGYPEAFFGGPQLTWPPVQGSISTTSQPSSSSTPMSFIVQAPLSYQQPQRTETNFTPTSF